MGLPNLAWQRMMEIWLFLVFATSVSCRRLTAASKHPVLLPRGLAFQATHYGQTLFYADGAADAYSDEPIYSAKLTLNTTHPAVVLDDYMERFEDVQCSSHRMVITFRDSEDIALVEEAWGTDKFLAITSLEPCAAPGHHQPYQSSYALYDHESRTATLWAIPVEMKDCTHHVHVEFGYDTGYIKPRLEKRLPQTASTTSPPSSSSDIQSATMTPNVTFTYPSSEATQTASALEASKNVDFNYVDKSVIPPDFADEGYLPSYPGLEHIALSCTNCTMAGQVELIAGGFDITLDEYDQVVDFLRHGFLEFSLIGLSAYMGLELSFLPGFSIKKFNAGLPPIPIGGLDIAGILQFGPVFSPAVPISVELDSFVNLTFGLELSGPEAASVTIDLGNATNVTSTGFDQFAVSLLPFNYTAQNLSLNLSAALQPRLTFSAATNISDVSAGGGIGVYLDLPIVNSQIMHLTNMTEDCTAPANGSHDPLYKSLINVIPSMEVGAGVGWNVDAKLLDFEWARAGGVNEPVFTRQLPTQCYAFDKMDMLVNATSTAAAKSAAPPTRRLATARVLLLGMALAVVVLGNGW